MICGGLLLMFVLGALMSRVDFPFVNSTVSGTRTGVPRVLFVVAEATALWKRGPRPWRNRCLGATILFVPIIGIGVVGVHTINAVDDHGPRESAHYAVTAVHGYRSTYAILTPITQDKRYPPLDAYIDFLTATRLSATQ